MIWYFCLFATLVILASSVILALVIKKSKIGITAIFAGLFIATFLLHLPIHLNHVTENGTQNNILTAILGAFVSIAQVVTVNAEYFEFASEIIGKIDIKFLEDIYLFIFGVIHFAMPAVSAATALTFIIRCLADFRVKIINIKKSPVYVFSCLTNGSVQLAKDVKNKNPRAIIVFASCAGIEKSEYNEMRNKLHCDFQDDKIEELKISATKSAVNYFCISDDDVENVNSALSLLSVFSKKNEAFQKNCHLFIFSDIEEMDTLIDSADKGLADIQMINRKETAAYRLMDNHPIYENAADNKMSLMILGFDKVCLAVLKAAVWCGQLLNYSLEINVICEQDCSTADHAQFAFPGLFSGKYNINILQYNSEQEMEAIVSRLAKDTTYVVVSGENDTDTIKRSLFLRRCILRADPDYAHMPKICAYIENDEQAELAKNLKTSESNAEKRVNFGIIPFGGTKEMYSYNNVVNSDIEKLAVNIHLVYEDIFSENGVDVEKAVARYKLFEVNKRSSRTNALHIRYKLALAGLDYEESNLEDEVDFKELENSGILDNMAYSEHSRWMAFLESEGWMSADTDQVEKYKASGISKGRHNCPLLKLHPYICPFEELKQRSDIMGLPDSRIYDKELIRRIPDILHDKWGVSGKNFRIIKKR